MKTVCEFIDVKVYAKGKMIVVTTERGTWVFSYDKKVIFKDRHGQVYIDPRYYNFSPTTLKHVKAYLGEGEAQIKAAVERGQYEFAQIESPYKWVS